MKTDRTIPYANIIMRCDTYVPLTYTLPAGYSIRPYEKQDETYWAALEYAEGDFDTHKEAEQYFRKTYLLQGNNFKERCFVVTDTANIPVGFSIACYDKKDEQFTGSVHWLIVKEEERGRGISKALLAHTMQYFVQHGEFPVYVHTQPWSYPAIMLYHKAGFHLLKTESFSHYTNEYEKAIAILKEHLSKEQIELLIHNAV